jgi:3',5'-cyclic AMP phosphodiesterase CpdA
VTVQILQLADLHFGGEADIRQIEALERMLPELRPDVVVIGGDISQRARHGEFQRARSFANLASETCQVFTMPGNHDVQWWRRPLLPIGKDAIYRKYRRYFGDDLTPTLEVPGALIASVLTSHGLSLASISNLRDFCVKGYLPRRQIDRVRDLFARAPADLARVLVVHHNVLRGDISQRMGLARWRKAQRRIIDSGADVVLCGHDHQEGADVLEGKVVVSTTGTLSVRTRGGRPSCFNFVTIDPSAVQVTFFRWEGEKGRFRPSDTFAFARERQGVPLPV